MRKRTVMPDLCKLHTPTLYSPEQTVSTIILALKDYNLKGLGALYSNTHACTSTGVCRIFVPSEAKSSNHASSTDSNAHKIILDMCQNKECFTLFRFCFPGAKILQSSVSSTLKPHYLIKTVVCYKPHMLYIP